MNDLVSTQWLAERLGEPGLVVVDASAHLPDAGRDPRAEFASAHIPGARYLDLANLTNPDSAVPAAIPTAAQFSARMDALGISNGDRLVIYDDSAVKTSARAWFIARMHGAEAAILDGGLGKWRAEGLRLETGDGQLGRGDFTAAAGAGLVRSQADMLANLDSGAEQVLDARGPGRFSGADPEPRPGMASGHIPGSRNLPFGQVLNPDGTFKDADGIRSALRAAGIDPAKPVVTTCGSGVTASVLLFAMHLVGKDDVALYDGSWSEWGADPAAPKETGAPV
jgi:thiosulfate/3-mercaptopyruvate sulfurtransferase